MMHFHFPRRPAVTMTMTMQCQMTTKNKTCPVWAPVRVHLIKSSLVPVPETPEVLCIR